MAWFGGAIIVLKKPIREKTRFKNSKFSLKNTLTLVYMFSKEFLVDTTSSDLGFDKNTV